MWDDDEKATALITSLSGVAAEIIQIIPGGKRTEFAAIMDALERKYGSKHVNEVSYLELFSRCQQLNERIHDYATEIERLANLAYFRVSNNTLRLNIEAFVKGLRDADLTTAVWISPKTETLGFALTQEAAIVLWTPSMKVRCTEVSSENNNLDVVCAVLQQVLPENKQTQAFNPRKCYAYQKPGRFARKCRSKHKKTHSTSPTRNFREGASEISNKQALN
ncbi:uncharacterized protein ACN2A1_012861 [Glossina fuscipes fuscipes]